MAESRPLDLRPGLRRFSTGAIAYGVIGLVIALLGLLALIWVNGRVGNIAAEVDTTVDELAITMDRTARVLHDASDTAESFSVTLTNTSDAVNEVAGSLNLVNADLQALEAQLRSVSILGNQPLGPAANAVGRIEGSLQGLQVRLSTIGDSLAGNTDKLAANATSLAALGDSVATLSARLQVGRHRVLARRPPGRAVPDVLRVRRLDGRAGGRWARAGAVAQTDPRRKGHLGAVADTSPARAFRPMPLERQRRHRWTRSARRSGRPDGRARSSSKPG